MRILHLADLHFDQEHYAWLEAQASAYDLVVIAGDLLERYGPDTPIPMQQQLVLGSLRRIAQKCKWLAVCTGNHDVSGREGDWLNPLKQLPNCILDYQNKLIDGDLPTLVTCCPWAEPNDLRGEYRLDKLLEEAAILRNKHGALWLVVHHSPPGYSLEGEGLVKAIKLDKPDYVLSGHDHQTPFTKGPFVNHGSTLCLNPGSPAKSLRLDTPPAIVIDTATRTAVWRWGERQARFS